MSPDDRRKAILDALIPLLVERGGDVTTKEIAAGGRDRRGHDLPGLPRQGHAAVRGGGGGDQPGRRPGGLRRGDGRGRRPARAHRRRRGPGARPDAADDGGDGSRPPLPRREVPRGLRTPRRRRSRWDRRSSCSRPSGTCTSGSPASSRRTPTSSPSHPETAALALRSLTFGSARPELGLAPALTPDEIADIVLDGVRTRHESQHPREK